MDISGFADNFVENDEHVPIRYYDYNKHANWRPQNQLSY
jgi:hypothetical protein